MDDPGDIRGWQRLSDKITTSGGLVRGDPARLAQLGIGHVINLALDDHPEALPDASEAMAAEGLAYTHIPIPFDAPEQAHYAAFKAALQGRPGPTHVHCIMNYRVSAFFYLLHRDQGMPEDEALEIMREQWDPFASDRPEAKPWADLLTRLEGSPTDRLSHR